MEQYGRSTQCENLNHRRANAPVSHCPQCGSVVNSRLPARQCSDTSHATARRNRTAFCVDCGVQLIVPR